MSDVYVSILIPIYNGFEYFTSCIESIKMQDYNKYEIIIGINGHIQARANGLSLYTMYLIVCIFLWKYISSLTKVNSL